MNVKVIALVAALTLSGCQYLPKPTNTAPQPMQNASVAAKPETSVMASPSVPVTTQSLQQQAQNKERDAARTAWEKAEAIKVQQYEEADDAACRAKGFKPDMWENPNTEAYYDCRITIAQKRISQASPIAQYKPGRVPAVLIAFYKNADKARNAFNTRDYQDHYACMSKGLYPGPFEAPGTASYLDCRAQLAEAALGPKVAGIFREDAMRARQEASGHNICTMRGYKKGTTPYKTCRNNYDQSRSCLKNVDSKLAAREDRDRQDCQTRAELDYPNHLANPVTRTTSETDVNGRTSRQTTTEPGAYTRAELEIARMKATKLCLNKTDNDRNYYRQQLEYECKFANPMPTAAAKPKAAEEKKP